MTQRVPPAVQHDLMTQEEYDTLHHLLRNSPQQAVAYAIKLCYDNVPLWSHLFLGYDVVPHAIDVWGSVQKYRNNLIQVARSHSKTFTITYGLISHHVCFSTLSDEQTRALGLGDNKYKDPRIMLIRESAEAATKDIKAIQGILESGGPKGLIKAAFGDLKKKSRVWNDSGILVGTSTSRDFTLTGFGMAGNLTGAHPRLLVVDDPVTKKNAHTDHLRNEMWSWWTKTLMGMIDPTTRVFLLGTPYFYNDLYWRLEETKKYNVVKLPALNRMPQKEQDFEEIIDDNGVRIGVKLTETGQKELEALWPCPLGTGNCEFHTDMDHFHKYGEHRSVEWLIHEKYLEDPMDFATQFMLKITGVGDTIIHPSMLRFFSEDPSDIGQTTEFNDEVVVPFPTKQQIVQVVHAWDHALSKNSSGDPTAFARLFRTADNKVFVKVIAARWNFPEAVEKMEWFYMTEPFGRPAKIVTEAIGFQQAYAQDLMAKSRTITSHVIEPIKKRNADKGSFLVESGLPTAMMNGQVYFDVRDKETIQELLAFTSDGSSGFHDDRVDAIGMGYWVIKDLVKRPVRVFRLDLKGENKRDTFMTKVKGRF